jgi:Flp pilus assembly protein TadB
MKTVLKIAIWFAAVFVGLFLWNVTPDFRPLLTWIVAAAVAGYFISVIVEMTVKRVTSAQQIELHNRLELLDRKVTALLRDALEQRRGR